MPFSSKKLMSKKWVVGYTIHDSRVVNDKDVKDFARLSGDHNPLHIDEVLASNSIFKKRVAHGMYIASFFSKLLGEEKHGFSGIYLNQNLKFLSPVYINDRVDVCLELTQINEIRSVLTFRSFCKVDNRFVIDGSAEIYVG